MNELLGGIERLGGAPVPAGFKSVWAQYSVMAASEEHRQRSARGPQAGRNPHRGLLSETAAFADRLRAPRLQGRRLPSQRGCVAPNFQSADAPLFETRGTGNNRRSLQADR